MERIPRSARSPQQGSNPKRHDAESDNAVRLVHDLAREHDDLPEEVITNQVRAARTALRWLGDDPEVKESLARAIDHNLAEVETALSSGAGLSQQQAGDQGRPAR